MGWALIGAAFGPVGLAIGGAVSIGSIVATYSSRVAGRNRETLRNRDEHLIRLATLQAQFTNLLILHPDVIGHAAVLQRLNSLLAIFDAIANARHHGRYQGGLQDQLRTWHDDISGLMDDVLDSLRELGHTEQFDELVNDFFQSLHDISEILSGMFDFVKEKFLGPMFEL